MNKIALAAIAAAAIAAVPASAQSIEMSRDGAYRINLGKLDTDAAGVQQMEQRIARAANRVCASPSSRNLAEVRQKTLCRAEVTTAARNKLEVALAAARSGGTALAAAR